MQWWKNVKSGGLDILVAKCCVNEQEITLLCLKHKYFDYIRQLDIPEPFRPVKNYGTELIENL